MRNVASKATAGPGIYNRYPKVWELRKEGTPRLSDLVYLWLREKIGHGHRIDVVQPYAENVYSYRIDGIIIGWVYDDERSMFRLASGEPLKKGEVRRRNDETKSVDPEFFDVIWERIKLLDIDCVKCNGYSISEYKSGNE